MVRFAGIVGQISQQPIQRAIQDNDPKRLGKLLSQKVKLRLTAEDLALALMEAISLGKAECVPPLLAAKADPNCIDEDGKTPMIICMESKAGGSPLILRELLKSGASPNKASWNTQQTALHMAARKGYQVAVKVLLGHGARTDKSDSQGNTPLMYAAREGHFTALKMIVDSGGHPDPSNKHMETPLMLAARNGHVDCVEQLLECGANPDNRDSKGQTPLMVALKGKHMAMVELLMSYQCDMNSQNKDTGKTILHWAVQAGDLDLVLSVLRLGAEPNIRDKDWETPFITAILTKRMDIVKVLMKHRCDIKTTDKHFNTGLHLAAREGLMELIPVFLAADLDCNLKTSAGQTPLMLAAFGGHVDIVSYLLDKGGNANAMDRHRATALVYAIMSKANDTTVNKIVRILIRAGCSLDQAINLQRFLSSNNLNKDDKKLTNLDNRPYLPLEAAFLRGRPLIFMMLLDSGAAVRDFSLDVLKQGHDWLSPQRTEFRVVLYLLKNMKAAKKQFPSLKELCRKPAVLMYKKQSYKMFIDSLELRSDVINYLEFSTMEDMERNFQKAVASVKEQRNTGTGPVPVSRNSEPFSRLSQIRSTYTLGSSTPRRHTTTNSSNHSFRSSESSEDDDVFRNRDIIKVNRRAASMASPALPRRSYNSPKVNGSTGSNSSMEIDPKIEEWVLNHSRDNQPISPMRGITKVPIKPEPPTDMSPFLDPTCGTPTKARKRGPRLNSAKSPPTLESMLFMAPPTPPAIRDLSLDDPPNRDSLVSNDTGFHSEDLQRPDSPTSKDLRDMKSAMMWRNYTSPCDSWDNDSMDSAGIASASGSHDSRDTDLSDFSRGSTTNDFISRPMVNGRSGCKSNNTTPLSTPRTARKSRIPMPSRTQIKNKDINANRVTIASQFIDVDDEGPTVFRRTKSCRK